MMNFRKANFPQGRTSNPWLTPSSHHHRHLLHHRHHHRSEGHSNESIYRSDSHSAIRLISTGRASSTGGTSSSGISTSASAASAATTSCGRSEHDITTFRSFSWSFAPINNIIKYYTTASTFEQSPIFQRLPLHPFTTTTTAAATGWQAHRPRRAMLSAMLGTRGQEMRVR